ADQLRKYAAVGPQDRDLVRHRFHEDLAVGFAPPAQCERRLHQDAEVRPQTRHLRGGQPAAPAYPRREPQLAGQGFERFPFGPVADDREPPFGAALLRQRLQQNIESFVRDQPADIADRQAFVRHMLRLVWRERTEWRNRGDREIRGVAADERAGEIAAGDEAGQLAQPAALLPVRPPALLELDVLVREQHDGDAEAARGAEHLAGGVGVGLFFDLDEIGAAVAQQRLERAAAVLGFGDFALAHAAGGEGKDLEAALPFPRDVDRPAEPRFAPALRNGNGDFEPTRR